MRDALVSALDREDWSEVQSNAQMIRGSGVPFGYPGLTKLGKVICDEIEDGDLEKVPDFTQQLIMAFATLEQETL